MNRIAASLICIVLAGVLLGQKQVSGQPILTTEKLVVTLRLLNTNEYSYRDENQRFADRDQMLAFLRRTGLLSKSPIDLEHPSPYELAITTSSDGTHYQITVQRPSDMNDKTTWCKTAAFSDERGVIFLGQALDCANQAQ
jgi:hypothetical protein